MTLSSQDDSLSFEIDDRIFSTPAELISPAQHSLKFRQTLIIQMNNGRLPAWFNKLGKQDWAQAYKEVTRQLAGSPDYTTEDQKMAALQVLLQYIEPELPQPIVTSSSATISFPPAEATGTITLAIFFELQNKGILKAIIGFSGVTKGVSVSERIINFNSLTGNTKAKILLEVDTTCFQKNKLVNFELIVKTLTKQLVIPIQIHTLFPKRAYALMLMKYGVWITLIFAFASWMLNLNHGHSWLSVFIMGFATGITCGGAIAGIKYKLKLIYTVLPTLLLILALVAALNHWL